MFQFEHPELLWTLVFVPVLLLLYWLSTRAYSKQRKKLISRTLFSRLVPAYSRTNRNWRFFFLVFAFAAFSVALANPQWGTKKKKIKAQSADIFIALDISQSMMAEDISPNRLERSKKFISEMIEKLRGDRIGIILFAGEAYLQMPLSTDYSAAQLFVKAANTDLASTQGTAINQAIDLAERAQQNEDQHFKSLVIITDGEDHDSEALAKAEKAFEEGMTIHTIGVGTAQGSYIPSMNNGREEYKRDKQGELVKSKLNENLLMELARKGGGIYNPINSGMSAINQLLDHFERMQKREVEQRSYTDFESYFQYFLFLGIMFFCLYFFLPEGKIPKSIDSLKS
jgi:Ca-activated chloride channel family protein